MVRSRTPSQGGGSQGFEMERKYSVPSNPDMRPFSGNASEDLHAWSIYRQNLNSDFTDSALGSTDKSPLPYGNFQLRDTTVQSILSHPRYGPKSTLGSNMYTYLKFGLPRVFPPNHESNRSGRETPQHFIRNASTRPKTRSQKMSSRGPREGSSGYDSSDNETANQYKQNRKYRSDPDFRMQPTHPSYHYGGEPTSPLPLAALQQGGIRPSPNQQPWNRHKSVSEANLLAMEYNRPYHPSSPQHHIRDPRRASVADFGGHMAHHDTVDHSVISHLSKPISKAESQFSIPASRKGPSVIRSDYTGPDEETNPGFLYPHLLVNHASLWPSSNGSCFSPKTHLILSDASFEARGGDLFAIMATYEPEGTAILDLIAGQRSPVQGEVFLNGQRVRSEMLRNRVAYAQNDPNLCMDMTAVQIMRFHYDLKKPTEKLGYLKIDSTDRINLLIEELGLEQVRNTKVSNMTTSERRRLNVACHLLQDTDIVVLDQPTRGMDIFDTFFLVEYLRQWANGGAGGSSLGRIVILTLHPPTYEIFMMLSRILLVSAGRVMFSGRRRDMLPYFALVDYPCPNFKNPSDYYLDLVTLDDLSAEAMLESSQRIEQLGEIFRQKQPPLSDPGPPSALPMAVKRSNFVVQAFVLFTKAMVYTQPSTFIKWLTLVMMSASLSLILGAIFWDIPNTDPQLALNDRLGYHYAVMCLVPWPLILYMTLNEINQNRMNVERDIADGLYGRLIYVFTKTVINLFPSLFIWLIYVIPSYSMSGLYMQSLNNYDGFYIYIGLMLLYLSTLQSIQIALIYLLPYSNAASMFACLISSVFFLVGGYILHLRDMPSYISWLRYLSPTSWVLPLVINRELSPEAIESSSVVPLCRNKQVQHQDIIVQLPCPPPNGTQVLFNYGYLSSQHLTYDYGNAPLAMVVFYLVFFVLACVGFMCNCGRNRKQKSSNSNKP
ncbi:ATP-binding cassette sub-family G member 8 isoform X2 [Anthonomus grandis grandis]|uniref:ATP-binding cassette sub-family G member 8 isoform X2 n=1 Tax=Anthonomus grandis grandis TaxID=2921223 RepID=UPI002165BE6D|nr:ATP-binding cassette sub-family G member 8 isoform X2 [Anthonomus grandis grandis]